MGKFKIIYQTMTSLGAWDYRVTTNGEIYHLQQKHINCRSWRTEKKITLEEWAVLNEKFDMTSALQLSMLCGEES